MELDFIKYIILTILSKLLYTLTPYYINGSKKEGD